MGRSLPPLNGLRAFEAAARHLSFTRAAEELHVTQAAISHQVKGLEGRLGMPLFVRLNRALMLTEAGQRLYPPSRDALDQLANAVAALQTHDTAGALTVSVLPSFAAKWLVPKISRFQERHPDIDLRISSSDRVVDLAREGVDVAIRLGDGHWPGLQVERVLKDEMAPVCSPALVPQLQEPADLAHATLLHENIMKHEIYPGWDVWLKKAGVHGVDLSRGLDFSHTHILLQAAMDGRGVALGALALAAEDIVAGRLVVPFDLRVSFGYAYYLVYQPATAERPKIKAFREWVIEELAAPVIT